jgi:sugar lactone lactonase YvrE
MNRTTLRRWMLAGLLTITAGCSYDSTDPGRYGQPNDVLNEGLWIASGSAAAIERLALSQLVASGSPSPVTTVTTASASLATLNTIAFDVDGTMWIASQEASLLLAFSPARLAASGLQVASRVIAPTAESFNRPIGIAFDRQHRLWVLNSQNGAMVRFDAAQIAASGAPAPAVVITGIGHPSAFAFDAAGSLWIADIRVSTLAKYSAAQLEASGSPAPQVVLSANQSSLANPSGLAFDAAGNLWVANLGTETIVSFGQAQLAATGSPAPRVTLSSTDASLAGPAGMAFDGDGSLWVMNVDGPLVKLGRADIAATGAPRPSVQLTPNGVARVWNVAFWPTPNGLPLN